MLFVAESGLYALIIRSNKPVARRFRKWIASEALPSLRKHGIYSTDPKVMGRVKDKKEARAAKQLLAGINTGLSATGKRLVASQCQADEYEVHDVLNRKKEDACTLALLYGRVTGNKMPGKNFYTVEEGIAIVRDLLNSLAGDDGSRVLINTILRLLSRDRGGNLKASRVTMPRRTAGELGNGRLLGGVRIIEEGYRPVLSKQYVRAEYKDEKNGWVSIPLGNGRIIRCPQTKQFFGMSKKHNVVEIIPPSHAPFNISGEFEAGCFRFPPCSGSGGFECAARGLGIKILYACEIDAFLRNKPKISIRAIAGIFPSPGLAGKLRIAESQLLISNC
ncbi:hypothetical protein FACS189435_2780 [Bacteroidia bacterium]|nr:hypothetical protein FACS189435_2780 [Bacteroidia bacterium]